MLPAVRGYPRGGAGGGGGGGAAEQDVQETRHRRHGRQPLQVPPALPGDNNIVKYCEITPKFA